VEQARKTLDQPHAVTTQLGAADAASFNSRFQNEPRGREVFSSLTKAKVLVANYVVEYNRN